MADPNLAAARIPQVPPSMYYIPDFITEEEESRILSQISPNRWISLSNRRLQSLPTQLTPTTNTLVSPTPLPSYLTPLVARIHALHNPENDDDDDDHLFSTAPHGINHCLINEYQPGQGIMPHEDGPAYHPLVATVSLGSTTVLDITRKHHQQQEQQQQQQQKPWRIFQEPRSLLLTTADAYTQTLHGIADVDADEDVRAETVQNWELLGAGTRERVEREGGGTVRRKGTRVSLTFRDVRKVSVVGGKIFGRGKVR